MYNYKFNFQSPAKMKNYVALRGLKEKYHKKHPRIILMKMYLWYTHFNPLVNWGTCNGFSNLCIQCTSTGKTIIPDDTIMNNTTMINSDPKKHNTTLAYLFNIKYTSYRKSHINIFTEHTRPSWVNTHFLSLKNYFNFNHKFIRKIGWQFIYEQGFKAN